MSRTQQLAAHPVDSLDERLDEALCETFPASDPIAVDPTELAERSHAAKVKHPKAKRSPPPQASIR